jgi:lipopolysaccharide export system permease protein
VRIISRYLLVQFAAASATIFAGLFAMYISAQTLLEIDVVGSQPYLSLTGIFLRGLDLIPLGVPISCVVGVVWSLTRAVRHREVTAIRSGGVPLRRALLPIVITSVLIGAAIGVFEDRVLVPSRERVNALDVTLEFGDTRRPYLSNERWWFAGGGFVFSAEGWDDARRALLVVNAFELDEAGRLVRRIDASECLGLSGTLWECGDARIWDFGAESVAGERVTSARINLGISSAQFARSLPGPETLTVHKLHRRIRTHRGDLASLAPLEAAFHSRLAQPFAVLILVLLAIPFAIGDTERGDSLARALLWSIGATVLYWGSWTLALLTGGSAALPPAAPLWVVTLLFLVVGSWRFRAIQE